jgi:hypothetical protein
MSPPTAPARPARPHRQATARDKDSQVSFRRHGKNPAAEIVAAKIIEHTQRGVKTQTELYLATIADLKPDNPGPRARIGAKGLESYGAAPTRRGSARQLPRRPGGSRPRCRRPVRRLGRYLSDFAARRSARGGAVRGLAGRTALPFAGGAAGCFIIHRLNEARLAEHPELRHAQ